MELNHVQGFTTCRPVHILCIFRKLIAVVINLIFHIHICESIYVLFLKRIQSEWNRAIVVHSLFLLQRWKLLIYNEREREREREREATK